MKLTYIEDYAIIKEGLCFLLSQNPEIDIVNVKEVTEEAILSAILKEGVDVVILDLYFNHHGVAPKLDSFRLCATIKTANPKIKVLAHSMYDNIHQVNKIFNQGADAFVSKHCGFNELVQHILALKNNSRIICSYTKKSVKNAEAFENGTDKLLKPKVETFTKSEKIIIEKIAKGFSNKEISAQLCVSIKTIEAHRRNIFDKAQVKNVSELIAYSYSIGILVE
jgi:DNA-binding NarL/FixJ family response regulator